MKNKPVHTIKLFPKGENPKDKSKKFNKWFLEKYKNLIHI